MTPERIAQIGEIVEDIYKDMTDELLLNISRHLKRSTSTWTALREVESLERAGQLTRENARIINRYVKGMPKAVREALNESRKEALAEIEGKLKEAAAKGYIPKPVTDSTTESLKQIQLQLAERYNKVNSTMLRSSVEAYQRGITTIEGFREAEQIEKAAEILTKRAAQVATGTNTRTEALREAIRELNSEGITGFVDRAGRTWSAEAYVNMDMRTTVHNAYIGTVKDRMQDYNTSVFQVSAHAGARPLCYPYQGKFYSWDGSSGEMTLGNGQRIHYDSVYETSYGQAAGLFGINCGHRPYPMIPNVSEPVKEEIQSEEENAKEYKESQMQRALERDVREAKRNVEMLGDLASDEDRAKVREAQARVREYTKQTGRARRYDREQIMRLNGERR